MNPFCALSNISFPPSKVDALIHTARHSEQGLRARPDLSWCHAYLMPWMLFLCWHCLTLFSKTVTLLLLSWATDHPLWDVLSSMSWRLGGGGFYIEEGVLWLRKGCLEHLCHAVSALEGLAVILSGRTVKGHSWSTGTLWVWWAPRLTMFLTLLHSSWSAVPRRPACHIFVHIRCHSCGKWTISSYLLSTLPHQSALYILLFWAEWWLEGRGVRNGMWRENMPGGSDGATATPDVLTSKVVIHVGVLCPLQALHSVTNSTATTYGYSVSLDQIHSLITWWGEDKLTYLDLLGGGVLSRKE